METFDNATVMRPPQTDKSTPQGRQNRKKLLRAWVEASAWLKDYMNHHRTAADAVTKEVWVVVTNEREMIQHAIGAHPDQCRVLTTSTIMKMTCSFLVPRGEGDPTLMGIDSSFYCLVLGMTPSTFTSGHRKFLSFRFFMLTISRTPHFCISRTSSLRSYGNTQIFYGIS